MRKVFIFENYNKISLLVKFFKKVIGKNEEYKGKQKGETFTIKREMKIQFSYYLLVYKIN
jgi:hypothetical protein